MDMIDSGGIKRIRQACANCRRKKTKCTGDRPICSHCRRNHLACIYEPYSATLAENPPAPNPVISLPPVENNNNIELLQRISTIESRLAELSGKTTQQNVTSRFSHTQGHVHLSPEVNTLSQRVPSPPPTFQDHELLPPPHVLRSVIDTYFLRVHNQPYSYFHEPSFRQKLESNSLPKCLILAVLSSAVRFSTHEFYANQTRDASQKYARESWLSVLADHLTMEDSLNVHVVQTVNLLAVVDYTAGRARSGWLKIGLAARISQDLNLMSEPDQWLSYSEQEEHRRAFWSIYLLDKLISCGRSRPLIILDEDCEVQLPCDEHTFRHGERRQTSTIDQLLNWNSKFDESPSPFSLVLLMASIFGRCTRYVHQSKNMDEIPPWDPKSEFSAINSSLLLLESYSKSLNWQLSDVLYGSVQVDGTVNRQEIGQLIFAHTLFHLCHCLLNHPFLVRRWLKPFGAKAPASFSSRALQDGCDHAKQLMDLIKQATDHGCLVESSFYAYCIAVAGGIHSLAVHFNRAKGRESDSSHYLQQSLDSLERLAKPWTHAGNIAISLREFHSISHAFAVLLDPRHLMDELDFGSEEIMWSMIDYAIMGADPSKKQLSPKSAANIPSPTSWVLGAGILGQPGYDSPNGNIFGGLTPSMRLEEVEQFLNCSPGMRNII
ncbi:transcriptional regulator family: Fungal Specific TF [Penicillium roqueforti]|nr:transcriptional regulator family: Fungal Specific TF [Penicillium roqueforti]KAI3147236.1 transcriptional regulator family: Fungal Specific TF [Penicillium roqueforti]